MTTHCLLAAFALFILTPLHALGQSAPAADGEAAPPAATFEQRMQAVVDPYLAIQDALARDTTDGVADAAQRLIAATAALGPSTDPTLADVQPKLAAAALAVRDAADLKAARAAFKALSKPMGLWATVTRPAGLDVVYCSMAQGGWLQKTGPIRNPYHGSEMLACGEVVSGPGKKAK